MWAAQRRHCHAEKASAWKLQFSYSRRFFSVSLSRKFYGAFELLCVVSFSCFRVNFTKISIVLLVWRYGHNDLNKYNRYAQYEHRWIEKVLHFMRLTCFRSTSISILRPPPPLLKCTLLNWDIFAGNCGVIKFHAVENKCKLRIQLDIKCELCRTSALCTRREYARSVRRRRRHQFLKCSSGIGVGIMCVHVRFTQSQFQVWRVEFGTDERFDTNHHHYHLRSPLYSNKLQMQNNTAKSFISFWPRKCFCIQCVHCLKMWFSLIRWKKIALTNVSHSRNRNNTVRAVTGQKQIVPKPQNQTCLSFESNDYGFRIRISPSP